MPFNGCANKIYMQPSYLALKPTYNLAIIIIIMINSGATYHKSQMFFKEQK